MKKLAFAVTLLASCSPDSPSNAPTSPKEQPAAVLPPAPAVEIIAFQAPPGWVKEEPSNRLRLAQYRVPDKQKQAKDAECTLSHFKNRSQGADEIISMWSGQMGGAEGKVEKLEGKCKVMLADYSGGYNSGFGEPVENARMLAAIVEASDGPWYFKLVGPIETVGGWREEFAAMVKGASR